MFYARINKVKVYNNREGFPVLFNRGAELRIYSHTTSYSVGVTPPVPSQTLRNLIDLDDNARYQKLLDAVRLREQN
jgi:hypothetical protein